MRCSNVWGRCCVTNGKSYDEVAYDFLEELGLEECIEEQDLVEWLQEDHPVHKLDIIAPNNYDYDVDPLGYFNTATTLGFGTNQYIQMATTAAVTTRYNAGTASTESSGYPWYNYVIGSDHFS